MKRDVKEIVQKFCAMVRGSSPKMTSRGKTYLFELGRIHLFIDGTAHEYISVTGLHLMIGPPATPKDLEFNLPYPESDWVEVDYALSKLSGEELAKEVDECIKKSTSLSH